MHLGTVFKKNPVAIQEQTETDNKTEHPEVPDGLLKKCNYCKKGIFTAELNKNRFICPKCGAYLRMPAQERVEELVDPDTFEEWKYGLGTTNPLHMIDYPNKVKRLQEITGLDEAVIAGKADIMGNSCVLLVMDGRFMSASMGTVVGEIITQSVERATDLRLPVVLFACSGGARMQEGMNSLMQMVKTSAAIKRHHDAGLLYLTVLTDPTTGGVTASFAMLGDIILAEPGALIGFAGPRVIEQTIRQKLPQGFQRAEFLLEHGFIDAIIAREDMRSELGRILRLHIREALTDHPGMTTDAVKVRSHLYPGTKALMEYSVKNKNLTAWERIGLSRKNDRPVAADYIENLFDDFIEFHGDRCYGDDPSICGGIAYCAGMPVTVIAQMKGTNTKENIARNFGMPNPEGYRKALRLMKQAEKFGRPVICFVDTPGAYPGMEAEERGQGEAIASNIFALTDLKTPVLSILIGEGGSGGALALAVADEIWMMENANYSILSPEGFASILWKDASLAPKAAKSMQMLSFDLKKNGFVEDIIPEPDDYNKNTMGPVCEILKEKIRRFLEQKHVMDKEELVRQRYERFRRM